MSFSKPTRYALGLTKGSVRAVLALLLVIATIAALLASVSRSELPAAAAALIVLTQAVVRDYFDASDRRSDVAAPGE